MLLNQIRSHFFYHTLNALQALIVLKPEAAYKMAGDFARYLRFTLDSVTADGGIGSFREEIRAVRAYADINQQQLGDRLLEAVREKGSIGLENVRRRIARFPGSELRITSTVGMGTQAVLTYGKRGKNMENLSKST